MCTAVIPACGCAVPLFSPPTHAYCTRQAPTLLEMLLRCWVQGKLGTGATPDAGELVSLPRTLIPVVIDKFGAAYTGKSAKWAFATALHAYMTTSWSEATGGCLGFRVPQCCSHHWAGIVCVPEGWSVLSLVGVGMQSRWRGLVTRSGVCVTALGS